MDSNVDAFGDYAGGTGYSGSLTEGTDFATFFIELTMGEVSHLDIGEPASTC